MQARARLAALVAVGVSVSSMAALTGPVSSPASAATRQRGVISLSAPVVQPGAGVTPSSGARLAGTVTFKPAGRDRPVVVQRRVGTGRWVKVARKRENRRGAVSFTGAAFAADGSPYTYRGVAARWRGLREVASRTQSAGVWTAEFVDEFSGTDLDPTKWADRGQDSQAQSRICAKEGDPDARKVSGGALLLKVLPDPERVGQTCAVTKDGVPYKFNYYLNGEVSTQRKWAFTDGTFAARIKFPAPRGQHGSFWLQPESRQYLAGDPGQSGAEVDVAEFFGKGYPGGGMASLVYNYGILDSDGEPVKIGGVAPRATAMLPAGDAWWKSYHVFSLEWTKNAYIFRIDGREHYRTSRGVSDVPEYLILSLLTSTWELADVQRLRLDEPRGTMSVDWARVWERG